MAQTDSIPNHLERDAPSLYQWAANGCGDTGHLHITNYEKHLRSPRTVPNEPIYRVFGDEFTHELFDGLSRAELHARLICLPHQVAIDRLLHVPALRPNDAEKSEQHAIQHRVYETEDCLRAIEKSSGELNNQLIKGARELEWLRMMVNGEQLPVNDSQRSQFAVLRRRIESGHDEKSALLKACNALNNVESSVYMLQEKARATRFTDAYEPDHAMIEECWRYACGKLYPSLTQQLAEVRVAMDDMRAHYDNMAFHIRQKSRPEPMKSSQPSTRIYDFKAESPERMDELLRMQGEGSNVVRLQLGKTDAPKGRGG